MAKLTAQRAQTIGKKSPPKKLPPAKRGGPGAAPGDLGCNTEFTAVGRGDGTTKQEALQAAHDDAVDTAKADCMNRAVCKRAVRVRGAKADATRPVNGKSTAVVEDVFRCMN